MSPNRMLKRWLQIMAGAGIVGVIGLAIAASIGANGLSGAPTPKPLPTPNFSKIASSATKAIDSTIKGGANGITWTPVAITQGTFGHFVPNAPKQDQNVAVWEITMQGTATVKSCPSPSGVAPASCSSKTYKAKEKAVVVMNTYQTVWVSGTNSPI
jgi:hypothetical protein